jgi:hypothetical protein
MGLFSNLFRKTKAEKEIADESDIVAEVSYKLDSLGDIYISCEWANASNISSFSELLWMVSNGNLLDETLKFIRAGCVETDDEEQYRVLLRSINAIMTKRLENMESKPLVKPTQVMTQTLEGDIS